MMKEIEHIPTPTIFIIRVGGLAIILIEFVTEILVVSEAFVTWQRISKITWKLNRLSLIYRWIMLSLRLSSKLISLYVIAINTKLLSNNGSMQIENGAQDQHHHYRSFEMPESGI